MANVLHKTADPVEYLRSVNDPDYSPAQYFINPDISAVSGVDSKYWKRPLAQTVTEMSQGEKDAVDALDAQAQEDSEINELSTGILKRFVLVLLDEINRARVADGVNTVTIAQLKNAMRAK